MYQHIKSEISCNDCLKFSFVITRINYTLKYIQIYIYIFFNNISQHCSFYCSSDLNMAPLLSIRARNNLLILAYLYTFYYFSLVITDSCYLHLRVCVCVSYRNPALSSARMFVRFLAHMLSMWRLQHVSVESHCVRAVDAVCVRNLRTPHTYIFLQPTLCFSQTGQKVSGPRESCPLHT